MFHFSKKNIKFAIANAMMACNEAQKHIVDATKQE